MPIRVLIIDDSVFMRGMLKFVLDSAADIEIVGTAINGVEGLTKIRDLKPDVVTLDIEMPGLTGIEVLESVMNESPLPVVMVSSKTQRGANALLDAFRKGAVDCIAKPSGQYGALQSGFQDDVLNAVRAAYKSNRKRLGANDDRIRPVIGIANVPKDIVVAIGISAGGPEALRKLIPALPANFPATVITQHMPEGYTQAFAQRLNDEAAMTVRQAEQGDRLKPGEVLIAPGSHHLRIVKHLNKLVCQLDDGPKASGFRPSVDVMYKSLSQVAANRTVAIVMTGMGYDGSDGIRMLKLGGAATFAQDQESSVVFGMPKAAVRTGFIDKVVSLSDIPNAILEASIALGEPVSA